MDKNTTKTTLNIPASAFSGDDSIVSVKFGDKCVSVGESVFKGCSSLSTINKDNIIKGIDKYSFAYTKLSDVELNTLVFMDEGSFYGCEDLTSIKIPNCKQIPDNAFTNCKKLSDISFDNFISIGKSSFAGCEMLNKIYLSNCLKIGASAFLDCLDLTDVYLDNPKIFCELLDENVFHVSSTGYPNKTEINTKISFYIDASKINEYTKNKNWEPYVGQMFELLSNKHIKYSTKENTKLELNDKDKLIEKHDNGIISFYNIVTSLKDKLFQNSEELTSINLPNSCTEIGSNEFEGCVALESIEMSKVTKIGEYAFKDCKSFKTFNIPASVDNLGDGVFAGCNISKFEGNLATYGNRAVVCKNKLICVTPNDNTETEGRIHNISDIDKNITSLGKYCFSGCENMRRVDIPSTIAYIGDHAFEGCKNLYEIHFEGNIPPTIGENIFNGIEVDFKIFVPENSIKQYITKFKDTNYKYKIYPKPQDKNIIYYSDTQINNTTKTNINLEGVNFTYYTIKNTNNTLLHNIFANNTTIKEVILGENITNIGANAFRACVELEYIYLSDKITNLQNYCFLDCKKLTRIHIPSKAQFGNGIFCNCKNLKEFGTYYKGYVSDDNRCYFTLSNNKKTLVFFAESGLKTYVIPKDISAIGNYAFKNSSIMSIEFTESERYPIETIGEYAFADCEKLTSIEKWESIKSISNHSFENCTNLGFKNVNGFGTNVGISLPSELETIGEYAFANCKNMHITTNIPDTVRTIGKYAFSGCSTFKYVDETNIIQPINLGNISIINEGVFKNCVQLKEVVRPTVKFTTIEKINNSAFEGCSSLQTVSLNEMLTEIGNNAFSGCKLLTTFLIPESVKTIGDNAFKDCEAYECSFPKGIQSLGSSCFENSGILEFSLSSKSNITAIPDNICKNCSNLAKIDLYNSKINTIGRYAFYNCKSLSIEDGKEHIFPDSVKNIDDFAFQNCVTIKKLNLPVNLESLGDYCLATNSSSTEFYIQKMTQLPIFTKNGGNNSDSNPFGNTEYNSLIPMIYVPRGEISKYIMDDYWIKYYSINRIVEYEKE